jgi:hypothetical protein
VHSLEFYTELRNVCVTIDGDRANAMIFMVARHWKATDGGSAEYT